MGLRACVAVAASTGSGRRYTSNLTAAHSSLPTKLTRPLPPAPGFPACAGREGRDSFSAKSGLKKKKTGGMSNREKDKRKRLPFAARSGQVGLQWGCTDHAGLQLWVVCAPIVPAYSCGWYDVVQQQHAGGGHVVQALLRGCASVQRMQNGWQACELRTDQPAHLPSLAPMLPTGQEAASAQQDEVEEELQGPPAQLVGWLLLGRRPWAASTGASGGMLRAVLCAAAALWRFSSLLYPPLTACKALPTGRGARAEALQTLAGQCNPRLAPGNSLRPASADHSLTAAAAACRAAWGARSGEQLCAVPCC